MDRVHEKLHFLEEEREVRKGIPRVDRREHARPPRPRQEQDENSQAGMDPGERIPVRDVGAPQQDDAAGRKQPSEQYLCR